MDAGTYKFDAAGKIVMLDGLVNEDGTLYYHKNGLLMKDIGLIKIEGAYYYIGTEGTAVTNVKMYVEKTNGLLDAGTYRFDADGKLIEYTGLVDEDGTLYYYEAGKETTDAGLVEYEGDYYYIGAEAATPVTNAKVNIPTDIIFTL